MPALRTLRRRSRAIHGERGFVMIVGLLVLLAVTLVLVGVGLGALDVNSQTTREAAADRASAAAEAGAQVALFRLNTTGTTTGASASLANGATYTYAVAPLSDASSPCVGLWVQNSAQSLVQDCITSTGTVDGVSQRVAERVVAYAPEQLFPVNGVFAINGFSTNDVGGTFALGSNGPLNVSNANLSSITGLLEYLAGNLNQSQNAGEMCTGSCVPDQLTNPIGVPTVAGSVYGSVATTNDDATGMTLVSNASFDSSTDILSATNNNATVSFAPGTYYLCGIDVGGFSNFAIDTSGSGQVAIYIDSPDRTGSGGSTCASGTGNIYDAANATAAINSGGLSSNLQMFFYGDPGCTTSCPALVSPMNAITIDADVFAPDSSITSGGPFTMTGALTIGDFTANNNIAITFQAAGGSGSSSAPATFYPSAHVSCIPSSTPGGTDGAC